LLAELSKVSRSTWALFSETKYHCQPRLAI
jgi:hypothetical protein